MTLEPSLRTSAPRRSHRGPRLSELSQILQELAIINTNSTAAGKFLTSGFPCSRHRERRLPVIDGKPSPPGSRTRRSLWPRGMFVFLSVRLHRLPTAGPFPRNGLPSQLWYAG